MRGISKQRKLSTANMFYPCSMSTCLGINVNLIMLFGKNIRWQQPIKSKPLEALTRKIFCERIKFPPFFFAVVLAF